MTLVVEAVLVVLGIILAIVTPADAPRESRFLAAGLFVVAMASAAIAAWTLIPRVRVVSGATAVVMLIASFITLSIPPQLPPEVKLEFVQAEVNGADPSSGIAEVDMSLRNSGTRRAALTGLEVTILEFQHVEGCQCGSDVPITGKYDIKLPDNPAQGQKLTTVLHQQIGPDELDRVLLRFTGPASREQGVCPGTGSFLYRVEIGVTLDGGRPTFKAGQYLIEANNGLVELGQYLGIPREVTMDDMNGNSLCTPTAEVDCQETWRTVCDCWNRNRPALLSILGGTETLMSTEAQQAKTKLGA